jgi:Zn-dependent metalloprotease
VDQFNAGWAYLDSQVELAKAETDRINGIKRRLERLQAQMEQSAIKTLEALGVKKLEGNTSFLRIQKKPDGVEVTDAAAVPLEYKTATVTLPAAEAETIKQFFPNADVTFAVSRSAVAAALKAGTDVPGARLETNDEHGRGHNCLRRK